MKNFPVFHCKFTPWATRSRFVQGMGRSYAAGSKGGTDTLAACQYEGLVAIKASTTHLGASMTFLYLPENCRVEPTPPWIHCLGHYWLTDLSSSELDTSDVEDNMVGGEKWQLGARGGYRGKPCMAREQGSLLAIPDSTYNAPTSDRTINPWNIDSCYIPPASSIGK